MFQVFLSKYRPFTDGHGKIKVGAQMAYCYLLWATMSLPSYTCNSLQLIGIFIEPVVPAIHVCGPRPECIQHGCGLTVWSRWNAQRMLLFWRTSAFPLCPGGCSPCTVRPLADRLCHDCEGCYPRCPGLVREGGHGVWKLGGHVYSHGYPGSAKPVLSHWRSDEGGAGAWAARAGEVLGAVSGCRACGLTQPAGVRGASRSTRQGLSAYIRHVQVYCFRVDRMCGCYVRLIES
ncbi:hypothetical protein CDL15_Pgr007413 [Punica granatum]|uniref:4Fe-4S ferredoxin-type domain-containing protein n=1 Tax=Punica granatum TaxID=22663 RepID=A0A218X842_PUNGR|nr:hypothetical protein CDL15_Pgr007413 [Punica granatum]